MTGIVDSGQEPSDLADAVLVLAAGGAVLPPDVVAAVAADWRRTRRSSTTEVRGGHLTNRELEVLGAMSDGMSTKAVAHHLGVRDQDGREPQDPHLRQAGRPDAGPGCGSGHRDISGRLSRVGQFRPIEVMTPDLMRRNSKQRKVDPVHGIEVCGVGKSLRGRPILYDVNLLVPKGTIAVIEGANGAGKTTLVRILATVVSPDFGSGQVNGYDLVAQGLDVRRSIGVSFANERSLYWRLNAFQNLELFGKIRGCQRRSLPSAHLP